MEENEMTPSELRYIKDAFSQIIDDIAGNPDWSDAASAISADLGALERELERRFTKSEDERIRKELIEALKISKTVGELKFILPEPTREECIAYLEKQKEQKPNFDIHFENGSMVCEQKEQKPRLIGEDSVEKMARQMYETGQTIEEQKPEERFEEAREKYQVEWSEEDENMFNDILLDMADRREMFKSKGETIFAENTQKKIDWLDSHHIQLKYQSSCLQPKQEWSDEDKEIIANATKQLYSYADSYHNASNYTREKEVRKVAYELKSLSPSWKPSKYEELNTCPHYSDSYGCDISPMKKCESCEHRPH